ncbi:hypothetical protein SteCoe_27130 [Stentor coeruleus]|uniref:Uncharacterized protein n=1 Tax=Stentor coeruleus TaxID=5963 RepID=A0A1R2BBA2_9CILI|nr:hypothetical protein SteCoe_27130 [Stentor coeruleus]
MAKTGFNHLIETLQILFLGIVLCQNIVNISGTAFSLTLTDSDCSSPVRTWLICHSTVTFFLLILLLIFKNVGFYLWILWNIVWPIIAAIWVFGDSGCYDDFEIGFGSAAIMISVCFVVIGIIIILVMFFGIMTCVGYCLSNRHIEIDS